MWSDGLVTQPGVTGSNNMLSFSYHQLPWSKLVVSEGKSKTFLALTSQFSIFYSPEQDKNKAEESFRFIFIFRKHIQCHLALNLEMSSDVERLFLTTSFTVRTGTGKSLWGSGERSETERAVSHGAACGCDCGDGHRGRSHLPASVGLPPLLLGWLSFPPPWWVCKWWLTHSTTTMLSCNPHFCLEPWLVSLVNAPLFSHSVTRMCSTPQIPSQGSACLPASASTRKLVTLSRVV